MKSRFNKLPKETDEKKLIEQIREELGAGFFTSFPAPHSSIEDEITKRRFRK